MNVEHLTPRPEERQFGAAAATHERVRISRFIRENKDEFKKILSDQDRATVAGNMWKMFERLKSLDVNNSAFFKEVFDCVNPAKYKTQFATAPNQPPNKRLSKKFKTYLNIVLVAERICPKAGDLVVEVFGEAQFWRKFRPSADSRHVNLARNLCAVMNRVASDTQLQQYFRDVHKFGGVFTPAIAEWQAERDESWSEHLVEMAFEFYGGERQHWPIELERPTPEAEDGMGDSIAAYPLVDLGGWPIGDKFPISVSASIPTEDGGRGQISGTVFGQTHAKLQLCIIPTGDDLEPTPALRVALTTRLDPLTEVTTESEAGKNRLREYLSFPWNNIPYITRGTTIIPARIPAGSIDCECRATVDIDVLPEPYGDYFPAPDGETRRLNWASALRFFRLTELVCMDWFRLRLNDSLGTSLRTRLADWVNPPPLSERAVVASRGEFEPGSLLNAIDAYLLDPEDSLDQELETSARTRIRLMERTRTEVRLAREADLKRLQRRRGLDEAVMHGSGGQFDQTIDNRETGGGMA